MIEWVSGAAGGIVEEVNPKTKTLIGQVDLRLGHGQESALTRNALALLVHIDCGVQALPVPKLDQLEELQIGFELLRDDTHLDP